VLTPWATGARRVPARGAQQVSGDGAGIHRVTSSQRRGGRRGRIRCARHPVVSVAAGTRGLRADRWSVTFMLPMPAYESSALIDAPPQVIWDILTDVAAPS
jgi:hypothetical protein